MMMRTRDRSESLLRSVGRRSRAAVAACWPSHRICSFDPLVKKEMVSVYCVGYAGGPIVQSRDKHHLCWAVADVRFSES